MSVEDSEFELRFREKAEQGDVIAQVALGRFYSSRDDAKAFQWFKKAAKQGNAFAQYALGLMYITGKGVPRDHTEAIEWFRKAAEQGHADAQYGLGNVYFNGLGVSQDYTKAIQWYGDAARGGNADAQYFCGTLLSETKKHEEANEWYLKAAEQGHAGAQYKLGCAYVNGEGVSQDYTKAIEWCRKAAEQGFAAAQRLLGAFYHDEQNYTKAIEWYLKAAEQGDDNAQLYLGCAYFDGRGVPYDFTKAIEWFRKAAEQGNEEAKEYLVKAEAREKAEREVREKAEREAEERKRKEREYQEWLASEEGQRWQAKEREKEKKRKKVALVGFGLQFGMMVAFFYMLFTTDVIFKMASIPILLIFFGTISLLFGVISLLFRRKANAPAWGFSFLILMNIVFSITMSIMDGEGIGMIILLVLLMAIPAIPGFVIIKKAENPYISHRNTVFVSVILVIILGVLIRCTLPNNKNESVTEAPTPEIPNATVTSDTLDLRFGPRMNSKVIKTLKKGDAIYLTSGRTRKGWLEIEHNNDKGYTTQDQQDQFVYIFPRLGGWEVTGQQGAIKMTAQMRIKEINNNNFSGYFHWSEDKKKPSFYGTESFRGVYDPKTRKVSIQGYELSKNSHGIRLDKYEAYLTEDNENLKSGTWSGGGVWEAKW